MSNLAKNNNEVMRKTTAKNKASKNIYIQCQNAKNPTNQANEQSCGHICTQAENAKMQQCKKITSLIWQLQDNKKQ